MLALHTHLCTFSEIIENIGQNDQIIIIYSSRYKKITLKIICTYRKYNIENFNTMLTTIMFKSFKHSST